MWRNNQVLLVGHVSWDLETLVSFKSNVLVVRKSARDHMELQLWRIMSNTRTFISCKTIRVWVDTRDDTKEMIEDDSGYRFILRNNHSEKRVWTTDRSAVLVTNPSSYFQEVLVSPRPGVDVWRRLSIYSCQFSSPWSCKTELPLKGW